VTVIGAIVLLGLAAPAAPADRTAPKITAAAMRDSDHDGKADRVVLTYSERISHPLDTRGFPFAVTGYRITRVDAARRSKTLVIRLKEKAAADPLAEPTVVYLRTQKQRVRDRAGNQARAQVFTKTSSYGPADTAITTGPSGTVTGRTVSFEYGATGSGATFQCRLDGAAFASCPAAGVQLDALADGGHTFEVRSLRKGKTDPTPASRTWTTDGDGDGSLAPDDCAPDDDEIHPGVADLPDPSFADTNCDGIDGDKALAVFVAIAGSDAGGTCGAFADPCRTISFAQTRAVALGKAQVYVSAGTYTGGAVLAGGVTTVGGFSAVWERSAATTGANQPVTIQGGFVAALGEYMTVRVISLAQPAKLVDLTIDGPTASGTVSGNGRSSYAIVVQSSTLELERVVVNAGNGAAGMPGANGTNATQTSAPSGVQGGPGEEKTVICDDDSRGAGGAGATNTLAVPSGPTTGGTGGMGGTMDSSCGGFPPVCTGVGCNAEPGDVGGNATVFQAGGFGSGGPGGLFAGSCEGTMSASAGTAGQPGRVTDGSGGGGGNGSFLGGTGGVFWLGEAGLAGTLGGDGGGGGGGGGAAGCDEGVDAYGGGGGGGGAGGVRAPVAGAGGGGGGSSFGVYAYQATVVVHDSDVNRGTGGAGGTGGTGGAGQPGGAGGPAGAHPGSGIAGAGGPGGRGGHSGGGGGGQGGHSFAFFSYLSTVTRTLTTTLGGAAGSGGAGGAAAGPGGPAGQQGQNGTLGVAGICALPASC
jgi:hypothetical protein